MSSFSLPTIGRTIVFLGIFTIIAIISEYMTNGVSPELIFHLIGTVGFSVIPIFLFTKVFHQEIPKEESFGIALIIFLALDYTAEWKGYLLAASTVLVAMISLHFIFLKGRHFFNSASIGLLSCLAASPFFMQKNYEVTWWGLQMPDILIGNIPVPLAIILLFIFLYANAAKWGKVHLVLFFYISIFVSMAFFQQGQNVIQDALLDPILLFLVAFLLTETDTSPTDQKAQIASGVFSGFLFAFFFTQSAQFLPGSISDHAGLLAILCTSMVVCIGQLISGTKE